MKQRVTLKDIARAAGVSTNAVSFVLHHTNTNVRVAADTAARIRQLADELGYRSNREARALIARRFNTRVPFNTIALLDIIGHQTSKLISDPYFSKLILGIMDASETLETDIVLCHAAQGRMPRLIAEERVDGVISLNHHILLDQISQLNLPIVTIGHHIAAPLADIVDTIAVDVVDGVRQAVRQLIGLGHRHIAYLGQVPNFPESQLRFQGYCQELAAHGLPLTPDYQECTIYSQSFQAGGEAMARLLARDPAYRAGRHPAFTAVICYNDCLAVGALHHLQAVGLRVPEDLNLVGYDDVSQELGSVPALTSVAYDRHGMGVRAVQLITMARDYQGTEQRIPCHELVPATLVIRESSAPPREVCGCCG